MRLGPYELVQTIGQGGSGIVWRGLAPDGREVAIKVLARSSADLAARFEREARLHSALGGEDGFVPLLGVERHERGIALVMPFMKGGSLREKLARGRLSIPASTELARRLAGALAKAHARGIVHRDLKPENVLFSSEGEAFVADLGVAKHFASDTGASQTSALSRSSELRGTAGYMPREQMQDAKNVGPASDVFALGAVIYECLTGRPAFAGETVLDLVGKVDAGVSEPLSRARADAPRALAKAVERALAREPAARFADAGELARALDARGPALSGALPATLSLALVVALLAGGAAALVAARGGRAPPPPPVSPSGPVVAPPTSRSSTAPRSAEPVWDEPGSVDEGASATLAASIEASGRARLLRVIAPAGRRWGTSRVLVRAPDRTFVVGREDGSATVFDLSRHQRMTLDGEGAVAGIGCAPRSIVFARGATLEIRYSDETAVRKVALGGPAASLVLNREGSRALVAAGSAVEVWDVEKGALEARHPVPGVAQGASYSDDERRAVVATSLGVSEVDLGTGAATELFSGADGPFRCAATPDGRRLLIATADGHLLLRERAAVETIADLTTSGVAALAITSDGRRGFVGALDGGFISLDVASRQTVVFRSRARPIVGLALDAEERTVAALHRDGAFEVHDVESLARVDGSSVEPRAIQALAVSAGGERLLAARFDRVSLWDLRAGRCLGAWRRPVVPSVAALSPDGRTIVLGDGQGGVVCFDASGDGSAPATPSHESPVVAASFLPDGRTYVTTSRGGKVVVCGVDGRRKQSFETGEDVTSAATSSDGQRLLAGTRSGAVASFYLSRGERVMRLDLHRSPTVLSLLGKVDDRMLAGSMTGDIVFSDRRSRLITTYGFRASIWCGAVRPDFVRFVTAEEGLLVEREIGRTLERVSAVDLSVVNDTPTAVAYAPPEGASVFVGTERGAILELALEK